MKPIVQAIPRKALVDDVVKIVVNHLNPNQQVTVGAYLQEGKFKFGSYAHFNADGNGVVDLSLHPSMGGSYTDVMPMGLFCSLIPIIGQRKGLRLIKKDVTTPLTFDLKVYDGIHHIADTHHPATLLACTSLQRSYLADGVTVQEIEHGNIRGRLFLPEGPGPFLGVIDMFGSGGNIVTFRSALLASRGFATLCLPYIYYKDLPKRLDDIHLEYFEEAVDWFSSHPQVLPHGVGAMGVSLGGEIVLCMASYMRNKHKLKAVVCINGNSIHSQYIKYGGESFANSRMPDLSQDVHIHHPEGVTYAEYAQDFHADQLIALEHAPAQILFVISEDDKAVMGVKENTASTERMLRHGRDNHEMCVYPGAGHLVEPPYSPLCKTSYHATMGVHMAWGGELKAHSFAQ
ncbi:PREDICTED: acyl-coenzyme A amino acid N-acyltransferase 1-like [Priapulus caudatus]|uniref:Acyl-coenzyme A amino acid N-acyltransferase 1-like n=1 Tax=Priapulus caudatus TaxID=37621 RepID=A0ABM1EQT1_PRICU|nr:PREDICTED: acyl-coenzyme A amino acid N-acyltransferase 1-like [Priapulus caudatus]